MLRHRLPLGLALLAAIVTLAAAVPAVMAAAPPGVSPVVQQQIQQHGWARVIVEVRTAAGRHVAEGALSSPAAVANQRAEIQSAQGRVLTRLAGSDHRVVHKYETVPFVALEIGPTGLTALQASPFDVVRVVEDQVSLPLLFDSGPLVQAEQAWARGFDGAGTVVAIIDTGIQPTHPFVRDKIVDEGCFSSGTYVLCPHGFEQEQGPGTGVMCPLIAGCEHATHVGGIAAGSGAASGVWYSGIAPGAQLASYAVFSGFDCGSFSPPCIGAFDSDILAALERIFSQRTRFNYAAVNMSLGRGSFTATCDDDVLKPAIDNLRSVGIATVVATGNSGTTNAISAPACISSAISVGATAKDNTVSSFSSAAPFMTLFAPGQAIVSSVPLGRFAAHSGTSMAAPHVAGVMAVLRQAMPGASVTDLVTALQATGVPVTDTRAGGTVTKPSPRLDAALDRLLGTGGGPSTTTLTPATATVGGAAFTLTVDGAGFGAGATVLWNGAPRPTTLVNASRLTASIAAADIASAAVVRVAVRNANGRLSNAQTFTVTSTTGCASRQYFVEYFSNSSFTAPATRTECLPWPGDVWPPRVQHFYGLGGPDGLPTDNFSVRWTGRFPFAAADYTFRVLSFDESVRLFVDGALVVDTRASGIGGYFTRTMTAGEHEVKIEYVDLTGNASISVDWLAMDRGEPSVSQLSPEVAPAQGAGFTLTVNGRFFTPGTTVFWSGEARPTTFVDAAHVTADIPADDLARGGTRWVSVRTADVQNSNPVAFQIQPKPIIAMLVPDRVLAGSGDFLLGVEGFDYDRGAQVFWNGQPRSTGFFNTGGLTARISAADVATVGTARITVVNGNGLVSNEVVFKIATPATMCPLGEFFTEHFANATLTPPTWQTFCQSVISEDWGVGAPGSLPVVDNFSVRWTGTFTFPGGDVTFTARADDGIRVFLDGAPLIDQWHDQPPTTYMATRFVAAGQHEVKVEYYERAGDALVDVTWTGGPVAPPSLGTLTPRRATAGGPAFVLTIDGGNFVSGATVLWNDAPRPTTFVSPTRVTANIPAADIAAVGTANVAVRNPNGQTSPSATFSVTASGACLAGEFRAEYFSNATLTPPAIRTQCEDVLAINNDYGVGGPPGLPVDNFSIRWTGMIDFPGGDETFAATADDGIRVFLDGAPVIDQWHDQPPTTYTARRTVAAGRHEVKVEYYERGGGAVAKVNWSSIGGPSAPTLSFLQPGSAIAGGPAFTLTANGNDFGPGATVLWNGVPRPSRFLNVTEVSADISAADIANVGDVPVTVRNADGQVSNAVIFAVKPFTPPPTLTTLTPNAAAAGGSAFTLTADGTNFVSGSILLWNGAIRATTFVSATRLMASIPASDISFAGSATVSVFNPDGQRSNGLPFTITSGGCPTGQFKAEYFSNIALTPPATRTACENAVNYDYGAGGPAGLPVDNFSVRWSGRFTFAAGTFTFTALADDGVRVFVDGAAIIDQWHDQPPTTYTATRTLAAGDHTVTVEYYERGGGAVIQVSWSGGPVKPSLTALTPASTTARGPAFTLTADGADFASGATLLWNGAARPTTFVSATRLTAGIAATDIATAGSATITVRNPDGQVSNALTFTIVGEGCPTGQFAAEYFNNIALTPPATRTVCESTIDNLYGAGGPTGLPVDNFSVRWSGRFTFAAGTFTFTARADDGVRVFLDGVAIIDQWHDQPATTYTATRTLTAGEHEVKVEYYERGGDAVIQVSWTGNTGPTLTTLTPASATAGGPAFTLTADGAGFVSGATLLWNGAPRTTTFISSTQLRASIPATDIATAGTGSVSVRNPDGQTSNALNFTINGTATFKVIITAPANGATVAGTVWFTVWIEGAAAGSKTYTLGVDGKTIGSTPTTSNGPVSLTWTTTAADNGARTATVTVTDSAGATGRASITLTVAN